MATEAIALPGATLARRRRSLREAGWAVALLLSVAAGGATGALVRLGRPAFPLVSLQWAGFAALMGAALLALFALQAGVLWAASGRSPAASARAAAWSFAPLLALWPLLLAVTFWDWANHVFVFFPGLALYWGGVGFVFALTQVAFLPVQLDGGTRDLRTAWRDAARGLRRVSLSGPASFPLVLLAYTGLRLSLRFAFDTARWVDPVRAYDDFYRLATLTDQGVYPYLQRWSEYPPGFPWLSAGVYRAVSFFGVTYERYYVAITLALLLFEVGILVLVYKLAALAWDQRRAINAAWIYTALIFPVHEWMRTFTPITVFFLLLAVYLAVTRRLHTGALATVLGGMTKVFPVSGGLLLLRYARSFRERAGILIVSLVVAAAVLLPFWIFGRPWFEASLANMFARPPWQTVWALADGYLGQGWVNPYRLNTEYATQFNLPPGRLPDWFWLLLPLALLGFYAYLLRMRRPDNHPRTQVQFATLSLVAFTLYLKGWSPGFVNWFFPFIVILFPNGRGLVLALTLGALEVFWRPLAMQIGDPQWLTVLAISSRTAILLGLGVWLLRSVRRSAA